MLIRIGTRGSLLATVQTGWVAKTLEQAVPGLETEQVIIKTLGDRIQDVALDKIGDKGVFVKELEQALLEGKVDLAVHSLKDMPSEVTPGLAFSSIPLREDRRDALVLRPGLESLEALPEGAVIGTGSKRRRYQLLALRPDLEIREIRGNIETRMGKIETEGLDGVVLAAAGLHRAGLSDRISCYLEPEQFVPAAGQGALALQYRAGDEAVEKILEAISDPEADLLVRAERSFLKHTHGGCHAPVGAFARREGDQLTLTGLFGTDDGRFLLRREMTGDAAAPEALGQILAESILKEIADYEG